ncbi:MAG: MBL fold metallo-hydrolase [Pseudomonadota bacterium]
MSAGPRLRFTILGCGSSGGVPRIGDDWGVCDPNEPKNRRLRCSALVERFEDGGEPTRVLIDTSPDLREQLLSANVDRLDGVLITHDHADQTHGIDDLRVVVIRHRRRLPIHMDAPTAETLMKKFGYCFEGSHGYPSILERAPELVPGSGVSIDGPGGAIHATPLLQIHGPIVSLGFRVGALAYCNDVSALPDETLGALQGLDVLIVDALRRTPHPSHANLKQALEWIDAIKPERAILTNMHVDMDYRTLLAELPDGVEPAYDGMRIEIPAAS